MGLATNRHRRLLTTTASPVALGSPSRLYCPAGSLLTMATSAPLSATQRLMDYSARLRDQPASLRGSPIYPASPLTPCRGPYSGGPSDCMRRCLPRRSCLRHIRIDSATTLPTSPERVGRVTKLQPSLNAAAWESCLPCSGQDFYYRAFAGWVAPIPRVGYYWMAHRHLPSPVFHRLDCQYYGLRTDNTDFSGWLNRRTHRDKAQSSRSFGTFKLCVERCPLIREIRAHPW